MEGFKVLATVLRSRKVKLKHFKFIRIKWALVEFLTLTKTQSFVDFLLKQGTWYLFNSALLRFLKVDCGDPQFGGSYPLQSSSKLGIRTLWFQVKVDHQQAPWVAGCSPWQSRGMF